MIYLEQGMGGHANNPSYSEDKGRRIKSLRPVLAKILWPPSQKQKTNKKSVCDQMVKY
jgi:hypothetical protein